MRHHLAQARGKYRIMNIQQLDHLVLTVNDLQASINFYCHVLGMQLVEFAGNRKALKFGTQKINLHQSGEEFKPHANKPLSGSADLCFIVETPIDAIEQELNKNSIKIEEGPVIRSGSCGPINSLYIRDPDKNLIELSVRV